VNGGCLPVGGRTARHLPSSIATCRHRRRLPALVQKPDESALEDQRIVDLAETDPLVTTIYDQLQYVADSSISPADSLIWDGFLNGVETVQTDPNADPQAVLDTLQAEIDAYMDTYE